MSTQYDGIGGHYTSVKETPGALVDIATLKAHLGDIRNLDVLDLACGSGFYARKAIEWGARRVVGLDISHVMVEEASRQSGEDDRLNFHLVDCSTPVNLGEKFDVVLAVWLLNYAATTGELQAMWQNISTHLKPGGRCLGIAPNFDMLDRPFPQGYRYGVAMQILESVPGGVRYQVSVDVCPPFTFDCYMLEGKLYECCAEKAGCKLEWLEPVNPNDPRVDFASLLPNITSRVFRASKVAELRKDSE